MNNYFIDTHAHIYSQYYEDIENVINNAKQQNIKYIINCGSNHINNLEVLDICCKYDNVYGALGIHPDAVKKYTYQDLEFIKNNIDKKGIIAIGEIGLDYHYEKDTKLLQIELFESLLSIAVQYNLPVIIHSREATEDTIKTLKKYSVKGIIHSFSGSLETAQEFIKMGYLLGINGVVTFKNSKFKNVLKNIGLEYIVLETDSPYLTPEPLRGRKNEPANVMHIANYVADLYGISLQNLAKITNENVRRIFDKV